jgi:hypothetical protein
VSSRRRRRSPRVRYPVEIDPGDVEKAKRRAEQERAQGIEENDAAGGWLAANDPADHAPTIEKRAEAKTKKPGDRSQEKDRRSSKLARADGGIGPAGRGGPLARRPRPLVPDHCEHAWATIAKLGGEITQWYCLGCGSRRPA